MSYTPKSSSRWPIGGRVGPGRMDLIPSLSRGNGVEKDGEALKDHKVQEEYREFIQKKLDWFWERYPTSSRTNDADSELRSRLDAQENVMIFFRKLREGLISSDRKDLFALEVYETSLYLSIIFSSPRQTTSVMSSLSPDFHLSSKRHTQSLQTTLITLLFYLVSTYPSQVLFHQHIGSLPLGNGNAGRTWITSLARCLRSLNYARFETLTMPSGLSTLPFQVQSSSTHKSFSSADRDLATEAFRTLLTALHSKLRDRVWTVIRSAYRELPCDSGTSARNWLIRSLCLHGTKTSANVEKKLDSWLEEKEREGHLKKKDGRWIVCRF